MLLTHYAVELIPIHIYNYILVFGELLAYHQAYLWDSSGRCNGISSVSLDQSAQLSNVLHVLN